MKTLITFLLLVHGGLAMAQTKISGSVKEHKADALPGVNVFIKGTYDGATTKGDGSFSFKTDEVGEQIVVIQFVGFKTQEHSVLLSGEPIEIHTALKEAIDQLNAVTITAGSLEASDEKKAVMMRPLDIYTTPSANGDFIGAFQTLPGTSSVGNDGRLFVRGGDASETAIFIDGLRVGNAFGTTANNVPTRTRFSPNLFKGSFFSTGGYSAEYGQALSSALALSTVDMPARNQGDLSIMSVGGGFMQSLVSENMKSSITASANYFNLSPYQSLIRQNFDWEKAPNGYDITLNGRQKIGKNGLLKSYMHKEASGMKLWQPIPGMPGRGVLIGINNDYHFAQANYRHVGEKGWSFVGGLSYSNNQDELDFDTLQIRQRNQLMHAKAMAIKDFSDAISVKFGTESFLSSFDDVLVNENLSRDFMDWQQHFFVESDYYLSNQLVLRAGLRSGYSSLNTAHWLDPRASLSYKFKHEGQVSLAYGQFHQLPEERFRVIENKLENSKATHYVLNYFLNKNGRTFRAEAFLKEYKHLLLFDGLLFNPSNLRMQGNGYAQGADFFYRDRKSIKNADFWVTYSFVDSKRSFHEFHSPVQPGFAPMHNGSVVMKYFITKIQSQLGASFIINDGYPYTNPNEGGLQNSKTRSFQDLSLNWSYLPKPNLIVHLSCSNVLGRDNVFGYQYATSANEIGAMESMPIRQGAPRFLFLGVFLTLSKVKSANQLNNL